MDQEVFGEQEFIVPVQMLFKERCLLLWQIFQKCESNHLLAMFVFHIEAKMRMAVAKNVQPSEEGGAVRTLM